MPGWIVAGGTTTGKLVKGSSGKSGALEDTEHFVLTAFGPGELLEDKLS